MLSRRFLSDFWMFWRFQDNTMLYASSTVDFEASVNKNQLNIMTDSVAFAFVKNRIFVQSFKMTSFECLKCKFQLTNDLYNQLVAFFYIANCLNTIFRSLSSKPANIATNEKYSFRFTIGCSFVGIVSIDLKNECCCCSCFDSFAIIKHSL